MTEYRTGAWGDETVLFRPCEHCDEDGLIWHSKWGGNDPDVWGGYTCPECDGEAWVPVRCDVWGCDRYAVRPVDGDRYCEDHAAEAEEDIGAWAEPAWPRMEFTR